MDEFEDLDLTTYDPVYFSKQADYSTPVPADLDIAIVKNKENIGKILIIISRRLFYPFEAMGFGEHYTVI